MVFAFRKSDSLTKKNKSSSKKHQDKTGPVKQPAITKTTASSDTEDTLDVRHGGVSFAPYCVVAEFPMILGDNPAVSRGAPVQLDWSPQRFVMEKVKGSNDDDDEDFQNLPSTYLSGHKATTKHRNTHCPRISSKRRTQILVAGAGYSLDQVADSILQVRQCQRERRDTRKEFRKQQKAERRAALFTEGKTLEIMWDDEIEDSSEEYDNEASARRSRSIGTKMLFLPNTHRTSPSSSPETTTRKPTSGHSLFGRSTGLWTPTQKTLTVTRNSSLWIKTF